MKKLRDLKGGDDFLVAGARCDNGTSVFKKLAVLLPVPTLKGTPTTACAIRKSDGMPMDEDDHFTLDMEVIPLK